MNNYYPSTALEAENLLTESIVNDPNTIVIIKSRNGNPVEVLRADGNVLGFSSLADCRSLCLLLVEAYEEGHDDGLDKGYGDGHEQGYEEGLDEGRIEGRTQGLTEGYANGFADGVHAPQPED